MSTVPDKEQGCPSTSETATKKDPISDELCEQNCEKKRKKYRNVSFPDDGELVTQYFEPANPWQHVPTTTRAQLAAEYLESCRRHDTPPIDTVLQQIRELPENSIGGGNRAPRLSLAECTLSGSAAVDALEALLRKVQFRRVEVDHAAVDDEGAEALFDMIEYYESATVVCLSGPRQFGIRGWQAASRMIKKSAELSELEITESGLEASHAPVLARALRPHTCRLRSLCLQRAVLCGEPLLCLVIALKSNTSIRELRLGDNRLTAADAAQLASLLRLNTTIHLLDLSNNQIQDAGAGHIAEALVEQAAQTPPSAATSPISPHHCPLMDGHETRGLAFLVLWNNQLTRNCAQHLSKALRSSHSLCVLNVGRNALGGDAVRALAGAGALVSLGLQAARLGPEAARAVADLVRQDRTLQRLDLRDNRLGSSGLQAILSAMKENTTLTQIDLDDVTESPTSLSLDDGERASVAKLTREIRALCRRNEPDATSPERRVHRKISLTCNTTCLVRTPLCMEEERRSSSSRLRSPLPSPAPSPAGSPVPLQHSHSRFSVTRVTPDRESSTDSSSPSTPTRPTFCPTPSRFKVVQVAEPPQIQVHPASSEPRKSLSRFSVTRNYDKIYNPSPSPSPVPSSGSDTPAEDTGDDDSVKDFETDDSLSQASQKCGVKSISNDERGGSPEREVKCQKNSQRGNSCKSEVVESAMDASETNSRNLRVNSPSEFEKVQIEKQTASNNSSDSVVTDDIWTNAKIPENFSCKAPANDQLDTNAVENLEPNSKSNARRSKNGNNKRFSVSSVVEKNGNKKITQNRFSTTLVPEVKQSIPSKSHSNTEIINDSEKAKLDVTSQTISVNITPIDSEISKRFSISDIPENVRQESSQISDNMDTSCIQRISDPENVTKTTQSNDSMTTPLTSKNRLKSCMRNFDNNPQGTSKNHDDVRSLRRENSETSEVLSSHPKLKCISDLFKSLEVYGNTSDNTVSLTSLTESKRPSVRDIFNVSQLDSSNSDIEDARNAKISNATDRTTNIIIDHTTKSSEDVLVPSAGTLTRLTDDASQQLEIIVSSAEDNDPWYKAGTSIAEKSHSNTHIECSTDNDSIQNINIVETGLDFSDKHNHILQSKEILSTFDVPNQSETAMDNSQTDELDVFKIISEFDRVNNLVEDKIPSLVVSEEPKNSDKAVVIYNQSTRAKCGDILKVINERKQLHNIGEGYTKLPKAENVISTNVCKNIPEYANVGFAVQELSPGSTPHPSKGLKTFVMPDYHIDDICIGKSDIDNSNHICKLRQDLVNFDTGHIKDKQSPKDEIVDNLVLNKNDLKNNVCINEKALPISIEDEFPVFDAKCSKEHTEDSGEATTTIERLDQAHIAVLEKVIKEWDIHSVPDLENVNTTQMLQTGIYPANYCTNMDKKTQDLRERNIDYTNVLHISEKGDMPTFLPEKNVFSYETDFPEFNADVLQSELVALKEISQSNRILDLLVDNTKTLPKVLEIEERKENLPGAIQPTLIGEIPIYSISQLANIPDMSRAIFPLRDVTTQTDLHELNVNISSQASRQIDSVDLLSLPGIVSDVCKPITRLTQTDIDLNNLAGTSKQIEIAPRQTELSIKESRLRSVHLPGAISAVSENINLTDKNDFSPLTSPDTNIGLEIQTFLEKLSNTPTTTSVIVANTIDNLQDRKNIGDITGGKSRNESKNVISGNSMIMSEINLHDGKKDSGIESVKHVRDTSDYSETKDIVKDKINERNVSGDQIIYKTVLVNENSSNKSNLIYPNFSNKSNLIYPNVDEANTSDNVLHEDRTKMGSITVDSKLAKEDSVCVQNMTLSDDSNKILINRDNRDPYKDISEVLTHNETKNAGVIKSETQLVKSTVEITDEEKIDMELKMTIKKENLESNICKTQKVKKDDPLKQIELITKDLVDLIDEMKVVTGDRDKKDCARAKSVIDLEKEFKCKCELPEKHSEGLQIQNKLMQRNKEILMRNLETDKNDPEQIKSSSEISDVKFIRDIEETEQYIKLLRENETTSFRDDKLEYDGKIPVEYNITDSHLETRKHDIEIESHRKESVIERKYVDDFRKELGAAEKMKKEAKDKPGRVKKSILKKNKSESSLDSSDMEVSRLMNKHINPFCDSSSSLEISGSSIESLTEPKLIITKDGVDSDIELDRRKEHTLSTGSSVESTDVTPMNTNLLNMSMSSNESVSPIFGKNKHIRDSLSSLEASVSSLESNRQDRVMVTSADSGIEHSLPKDIQDSSSNEGTLTNPMNIKHDTLTASPKRASSLLDVPALKSKGLDKMRKISWVAPSSSFNVAKQDDKDAKPSHLEKLLSLFQHPSSIFSRSTEEEKKSSTPPKKDSLLTSSFWSWGSGDRDKDDSSEATDSTLSERVQVSFIDESFSKKLDSKTPSTDTENTLSEFQTFTQSERDGENVDACKVTLNTTDTSVVQIGLSLICTEANNDNKNISNSLDVVSSNDLNKNVDTSDSNKNLGNSPEMAEQDVKKDEKPEVVRPRSFAAVLKASGSENSLEKQNSPEGQPVNKLPSKVIRGIKENISPENTLTSSMSNTKALALELSERQLKNQPVVNTVWEFTNPLLDKGEEKSDLAPIATIEETCDESADLVQLDYIDDDKAGQKEVDVAKDALSYLVYENQDYDHAAQKVLEKPGQSSLADELKEAEIKEMFDLSPELVIDEAIEVPEVFTVKDVKGVRTSPIIPERAKLKKSNSLEDLKTEMEKNTKAKSIVFKVPESKPRDIPERSKLRSRTGSSPKSLPESLNKPYPLAKLEAISKKKKKVSSLGKMAKDSLLALNMSEDEIAEFRRSYKLTSVESLRSLESVSEDANSQSGNSVDSRCRACLRTSQESLMSLDSITEDVCRCNDGEKPGKSHR